MAPSGIDPTKAGERETRGGAPAISDLLRTAIVVSLPMLSSAPAAADNVVHLDPFTYEYTIINASGDVIGPPASPRPINIKNNRSVGQFKGRYGTVSGYYDVIANSLVDQVDAKLTFTPGPTAPGAPPVGGGYITLIAETHFQMRVAYNPGAKPPEDINKIPILGMAAGATACGVTGHGAAVASADIRATQSGQLVAPLVNPHAGSPCGLPVQGPPTFGPTPFTEWWSFEPDETVSVTESVIGNASGGSDEEPVSVNFYAYLDPTFEIDPSWAYAKDFQLEISPGYSAGGGGAVPEPSTWALMLLGFAGLGFARYFPRVASAVIKKT